MEKLLEHDIFKLKELKRWLGENKKILWPNGNYAAQNTRTQFIYNIITTYILKLISTN